MEDRILDIVVFMMSHLHEKSGDLEHLNELVGDLQSQGFTSAEINSAYSWVFDRFGAGRSRILYREQPAPNSARVMAPQERLVLEPDAFGYLLRLQALGILRQTEFEDIIESCSQAGRIAVDVGEIKEIVSGMLFSEDSGFFGSRAYGLPGDDTELVN